MQKLFTLCSALSLLLCVATCVLWVRSYFGHDVQWSPADREGPPPYGFGLRDTLARRFRPPGGAA